MAAYTDDQWDQVLASASGAGLWSLDDTKILQGLLNSSHTFGLHFLNEILDIRVALVESLVAAPMLSDEDVRQITHFKGQVMGVDKIIALIRELAEKDQA